MNKIDAKEAYRTMILYLGKYYHLTNSSDVGGLLVSMQLLSDGMPADRAIWNEWLEIINDIKK